ncbi:hypothetical protein [Streptomyces sp. NPDC101115]|uniref:hypothetical protein n=1 Tax=Streptomyces sp. NPDC101115 TaxID=3366106 RepID=UPI00380F809D
MHLGVLDARFIHGGFPADAFPAGCFDLVETSAFGGLAAKRVLPHDLGEPVFEGACEGVAREADGGELRVAAARSH